MIAFAETFWELLSLAGVFFLGIATIFPICRWLGVPERIGLSLYLWHSLFCLVYIWYSLNNPADSIKYFLDSLHFDSLPMPGSRSVIFFNSFFSQLLGMSYGGCFFVFNIIGTIGLIAFLAALRDALKRKARWVRKSAIIIAFFPGFSFWTTAIGKDGIAFCGVGLICWAVASPYRRFYAILIGILLMMAVRPHMAAILIVTLALALSLTGKISLPYKIISTAILIPASVSISVFAVGYVGLEEFSTDSALAYMEERQGYNTTGDSSVDIASSSVPMRMFMYVFRPLFFDANGAFGLIVSIENLIALGILMAFLVGFLKRSSSLSRFQLLFFSLYVIFSWLILSNTTANLGIAIRQKTMFTPMFLLLALSYLPRLRTTALTYNRVPSIPSLRRELS
jgi:hypothetical protein